MNEVEAELFEGPQSHHARTGGKQRASASEKKVHWSGRYVSVLLDCVETRMSDFKNKSIHKKVWEDIGREMGEHGFSSEHCYNKWKNLRRDVRMVALHPERGARNEHTLGRVQALISSICPSFDPRAGGKKSTARSPLKLSEGGSSHSLEPLGKLLSPAASPFSDVGSVGGGGGGGPGGGGGGGPGGGGGGGDLSLGHNQHSSYTEYTASSPQPRNLFLTIDGRASRTNTAELVSSRDNNAETCTTWQYELYDLLLQFRAEEAKQAHSIAHMSRQIHEIKDCSVRRMNTIQQLINLAHVLINNKVS